MKCRTCGKVMEDGAEAADHLLHCDRIQRDVFRMAARDWMDRLGLTQVDVGKVIKVTKSAVSRKLNGSRRFTALERQVLFRFFLDQDKKTS